MQQTMPFASLNQVLRAEIAALETYEQALEAIDDVVASQEVQRILAEHREAVSLLSDHIRALGGVPDYDPASWRTWVSFVEGTAKLFGARAALKALSEGEERGLKDYESALNEVDLTPESRALLIQTLRPRMKEHIVALQRCLDHLH